MSALTEREANADDGPKAPPGWYEYDENRQAYWDGERWTQHFRAKPNSRPTTPTEPSWLVETYRRLLPNRGARIAFWVLTPLVMLLILGAIFGEEPEEEGGSGAGSREAQAPEPEELSPRQQIEALAEDEFGDQLQKVEITKQRFGPGKGGYYVFVSFNEPTGLTGGTTKLEIGNEMRDAYPAFFDADVDVSEVRIEGNVRLVDKFGKKSWGPGWVTQMTAEKGEKVDWSYFQDLAESPPWKVILLRPDL
jgi:hypothetical protein